MKSYTSLEQSKKLAEILSLESADMFYRTDGSVKLMWEHLKDIPVITPCWSLMALLNVIPKHIKDYNVLRIDISEYEFAIWYEEIGYGINNDLPDITIESAIDTCYEMILKLHEQKLL